MNYTPEDMKRIRKLGKLSQEEFAEKLDLTREMVSNMETGKNPISKSTQILLREIESEIISQSQVSTVRENDTIYTVGKSKFLRTKKTGLIPYYDSDFAAGDIEFYDDNSHLKPSYYMDIPEFSGCTAFRAYSDSMEKLIKSGNILFGIKLDDWQSHLEYGQIYGIVMKDRRRYLKYIRRSKNDSEKKFLLKSENEHYDDFEVPKEKIKNIWLIEGWLNRRT